MLRSCSWWISPLGLKENFFFNHPVSETLMYKYRRSKGSLWATHAPWHPRLLLKCPTWPCAFFGNGGVALGRQAVGAAADWSAPPTTQKECPTAMAPWQQVPRRPKSRLAPSLHDWASTCPTQIGQVRCGSWSSKLDRYWTFWLNVKITCETLQIGHWLNVSCWFLIEKMQYKKTIC